jgi:CDP-diacylglycerol---glycerol-3-phosphate 3-phosphatidyltransferase
MNLPNKLTVSRLVLTVVFLVAMFWPFPLHKTAALVVFIAASITDYLDGSIARRRKLITNFGILMDPLADKILICSAFIAFVGHDVVGKTYVQAWMVIVIVARELAITGLRLLAANKQVVLAAEGYGKHKTGSQIACVISVLLLVSYPEWGAMGKTVFGFPVFGRPWVEVFTWFSAWLAVALTFISGWLYLWRNRQLYLSDM